MKIFWKTKSTKWNNQPIINNNKCTKNYWFKFQIVKPSYRLLDRVDKRVMTYIWGLRSFWRLVIINRIWSWMIKYSQLLTVNLNQLNLSYRRKVFRKNKVRRLILWMIWLKGLSHSLVNLQVMTLNRSVISYQKLETTL